MPRNNRLSAEAFIAAATKAMFAATPATPTEIEFPRLTRGKKGEPIGASRRMTITKCHKSKRHDHLLSVWELGSAFPRTIDPSTVREYRRENAWIVR